jgi:hypothetical protein
MQLQLPPLLQKLPLAMLQRHLRCRLAQQQVWRTPC